MTVSQAGLKHLIAVAMVLAFRFIKGKKIRVGFYFLGTITPIVLFVGWMLFGVTVENFVYHQNFDAKVWQNQANIEHDTMWPPRLCMVDDLISNKKLDGLTKSQVVQLLGPPHDKSFPFGATNANIHYYLGPDRGLFRIDSEWLFITFREDGKVNRYWLYQD